LIVYIYIYIYILNTSSDDSQHFLCKTVVDQRVTCHLNIISRKCNSTLHLRALNCVISIKIQVLRGNAAIAGILFLSFIARRARQYFATELLIIRKETFSSSCKCNSDTHCCNYLYFHEGQFDPIEKETRNNWITNAEY